MRREGGREREVVEGRRRGEILIEEEKKKRRKSAKEPRKNEEQRRRALTMQGKYDMSRSRYRLVSNSDAETRCV